MKRFKSSEQAQRFSLCSNPSILPFDCDVIFSVQLVIDSYTTILSPSVIRRRHDPDFLDPGRDR